MGKVDVAVSNVVLDEDSRPVRQVLITLPWEFFAQEDFGPLPKDEVAKLIGRQVVAAIDEWSRRKAEIEDVHSVCGTEAH